ncbi:Uncharacterised protein [Salmonella enterica subsp. houtenae serovar Houten]|nr:Uncharacterised protein [Salmonella enterica subsp. houtenae serovar Houten]
MRKGIFFFCQKEKKSQLKIMSLLNSIQQCQLGIFQV